MTYSNGVTDNQLRALNRAGLFYPALDEASITDIEALSALTNTAASYRAARPLLPGRQLRPVPPTRRHRHHLRRPLRHAPDQPEHHQCHRPSFNLGYDNAKIVAPDDVWRSMIYQRMNVVNPAIQMPPLARNLIDTNAVASHGRLDQQLHQHAGPGPAAAHARLPASSPTSS